MAHDDTVEGWWPTVLQAPWRDGGSSRERTSESSKAGAKRTF